MGRLLFHTGLILWIFLFAGCATMYEKIQQAKQQDDIAFLVQTLKDEDSNVRREAAAALDRRAVEPLIGALKDEDSVVRIEAAWALGQIKDPRAVEPLIAALKDEDSGVRRKAAGALGRIRDPRAVEPLIVALKDEDPGVRREAAGALGEMKDPRGVEPLIVALKDADWSVRTAAAGVLGEIKDSGVVEPLIVALKDEHFAVRIEAAWALGEIKDPRAVQPLIGALQEFQKTHPQSECVAEVRESLVEVMQEDLAKIEVIRVIIEIIGLPKGSSQYRETIGQVLREAGFKIAGEDSIDSHDATLRLNIRESSGGRYVAQYYEDYRTGEQSATVFFGGDETRGVIEFIYNKMVLYSHHIYRKSPRNSSFVHCKRGESLNDKIFALSLCRPGRYNNSHLAYDVRRALVRVFK